jgi:transposase
MDKLLAQGYSMDEVINLMKTHGNNIEGLAEAAAAQREKKQKADLDDPNMTAEEKMKLLKETLSDEAKAAMDKLLAQGYSMDEVLNLMKTHGDNIEGLAEAAAAQREENLKAALDDPNMSTEDKMKLLKENLSDEAKAAMDKLLAEGYTMEEVMNLMKTHGNDIEGLAAAAAALNNEENDLKRRLKELAGGRDLTDDQMVELMKSQLGAGSRAELEAMLASGVSLEDAMKFMMRNGKTEEEEQAILAEKIRKGMEGKNMTDQEKIDFLRHNLSAEARAAMDDLLAQGYSMEEVIELFKKHGNNLNAIDQELSCPSVIFEDEPADAHLHVNRDVFTVIDRETVKAEVPYLSPSVKNLTFKQFIDRVQRLVKGRGLTHRSVQGRRSRMRYGHPGRSWTSWSSGLGASTFRSSGTFGRGAPRLPRCLRLTLSI